MYSHLLRWISYLESRIGRPLEPDDYIFPQMGANGVFYPKEGGSYDVAQALLSKFTMAAGLKKVYTTHCFRRGGAQYRFMFAPLGKRWSLTRIRWWGGFVTVQVDTLIKYLVDSLQSYETGHGNALIAPASVAELRLQNSLLIEAHYSVPLMQIQPSIPAYESSYLLPTIPPCSTPMADTTQSLRTQPHTNYPEAINNNLAYSRFLGL